MSWPGLSASRLQGYAHLNSIPADKHPMETPDMAVRLISLAALDTLRQTTLHHHSWRFAPPAGPFPFPTPFDILPSPSPSLMSVT